jgi:hypothetical protein
MKKVFIIFTTLVLIAGFCTSAAVAGDYPTKPITIIVPWGAGGMSNLSTRMLGEQVKKHFRAADCIHKQTGCQRHHRAQGFKKRQARWVYACFRGFDFRLHLTLFLRCRTV